MSYDDDDKKEDVRKKMSPSKIADGQTSATHILVERIIFVIE